MYIFIINIVTDCVTTKLPQTQKKQQLRKEREKSQPGEMRKAKMKI